MDMGCGYFVLICVLVKKTKQKKREKKGGNKRKKVHEMCTNSLRILKRKYVHRSPPLIVKQT